MLLAAKNITRVFGRRTVLSDVSFCIDTPQTVGFLGLNGAGKTTTMRILAGYDAPTSGAALLRGMDPALPRARQRFGYLPEANPLPLWMRGTEYLVWRACMKGIPAARAAARTAAERAKAAEFAGRIIGQMSKGMRQRIGLAEALLGGPEVLILDEPTAGLDPRQADEAREVIASLSGSAAVLLSSHILADVEKLCPRVVILDNGRVAADGATADVCLRHARTRTLRLELEADATPTPADFTAVTGVLDAAVQPAGPGAARAVLTTAADRDVRRDTALLASARGWIITEMRLDPLRLEDIFRTLTGGAR